MNIRRRVAAPSFRRSYPGFALAAALALAAPEVRADLFSPPPPCEGKVRGAACSTLSWEPGVCRPAECRGFQPPDAGECLDCVVPPDPPVNDGPAAATTAAPAAPLSAPPPAYAAAPRFSARTAATAAAVITAAGALAILFLRRKRKP